MSSTTLDLFGHVADKPSKLSVLFSAESDEWPTDQAVVDDLAARHGPFALDVAATPASAKAPRFYTAADNALVQHWAKDADGGVAWCNPPYSKIGASSSMNPAPGFVEKALEECARGLRSVVFLLPVRSCRLWFHRLLALADAHRMTLRGDPVVEQALAAGITASFTFCLGRLRFGGVKGEAPFPSVVVVVRRS